MNSTVQWYLEVTRILRNIKTKAVDARECLRKGDISAAGAIQKYLTAELKELLSEWKKRTPKVDFGELGRHIRFGEENDYDRILATDIQYIEHQADIVLKGVDGNRQEVISLEHLLDATIKEHAYDQFRSAKYRDAVFNSVLAVLDLIRKKTGLSLDGDALITRAFSLRDPMLILSEIESETGKNDQLGFMQIFQGVYKGIRNPKAHSLDHDLTMEKCAQYLVFMSLLARRINESKINKQ